MMVCELCGDSNLIKKDGVFVCQKCGCKYSVEEARKLMGASPAPATTATTNSEVQNAVKNELLSTFLEMGFNALTAGNGDEARQYAKKAIETDIRNLDGWLLLGLFHTRSINNMITALQKRLDTRIKNYQSRDERFNRKLARGSAAELAMALYNGTLTEHNADKNESFSLRLEDEQALTAAYAELMMCCGKLKDYNGTNKAGYDEIAWGTYLATMTGYVFARNVLFRHVTDANTRLFTTALKWLSALLTTPAFNWIIKMVEKSPQREPNWIFDTNGMVAIVLRNLSDTEVRSLPVGATILDFLAKLSGLDNASLAKIRYAKLSFAIAGQAPFAKKADVQVIGGEVLVNYDRKVDTSRIDEFTDDYVYCLLNGKYLYMSYNIEENNVKQFVQKNLAKWQQEWQEIVKLDPKMREIMNSAEGRVSKRIKDSERLKVQLNIGLENLQKIKQGVQNAKAQANELNYKYRKLSDRDSFVFFRDFRLEGVKRDTHALNEQTCKPLDESFTTTQKTGEHLTEVYPRSHPFVKQWNETSTQVRDALSELNKTINYIIC